MARLQYQPATKARGFQPIQLSRAGIARMEEEGNRVIRNLEQQRDATNSQRQEDLRAMQANSAYENQARERDQRILQQNLKIERESKENDRKFKIAEADRKSKNINAAVTGLIEFSSTLAKRAAERTKTMIEDQTEEGAQFRRQEYLSSPKLQADFATVESQVDVETEILDQRTLLDGAKGLDSSLETAKNLASNPGRGYYWKKGYYNELIIEQTPLLVNRALQDTEERFVDENGNNFSGIKAVTDPNKMRIVLGQVQKALYGAAGLNINSLEPGFLEKSSKVTDRLYSTYIQRAAAKATDIQYGIIAEQAEDLRTQGKTQAAFLLDSKNPKLGREGALKNYFGLFYAQNADGSFRYSVDELNANVLTPDGQTVFQKWGDSQRYQNAIAARRKAKTDFIRDDQARVKTEAKEFDRQAATGLENLLNADEANPERDLEILATFKAQRKERFGSEPLSERIVNLEKSILAGNKTIEEADLAQKIRLRTLDPEAIEGYTNPTVQGKAAIAYKELQAKKFGPNYADTKKDIKNRAEKLADLNTLVEGRGSRQSFMAITAGENEFQYAYKKNIEAGMSQEAAEQKAREYVETVMSDTENKDSLFYKTTGPLNTPVFPNLEAKYNTLAGLAMETRQELRKGLLKKGIAVLDTPGAVGTEEELVSSTNDYYNNNGQFKYNSNELLVSKLFKVPPYAVRNAAITAFNKAKGTNHRLIEPTQLEKEVFDQDPKTLKLITDTDNITGNRFKRAIPGQVYPMRRTFDTSRKEKAYIDTIRTVEGTAGPQGYNTVYGGAVVPQLTQMTLGELYDAIKLGGTDAIPARLGGGKIPFKKDKYNSSASGALQLMPETLRGLINSGNFSETDIFSPDTQDRMFLQLSREGGIDINNPDFNKAGNIWAGASPALGQTNRTASDTMSIYNRLLDQN
jgi:muramidase (phage lysozyme)